MSYILDALRKSEHERQASSARGAGLLLPPAVVERPSRRPLFALAAAIGTLVVLAAIGVGAWSLRPEPVASSRPAAADPVAALPAAAPIVAPPALAAPAPAAPRGEASGDGPPSTAPAKRERTPASVAASPARTATAATAAAVPTAPAPAKPAAAAAADDALKGLPALTISGFIDDDAGKLAIINDQLVREGEEVAPGLRLEAIEGDKALFNFKGRRFRR